MITKSPSGVAYVIWKIGPITVRFTYAYKFPHWLRGVRNLRVGFDTRGKKESL